MGTGSVRPKGAAQVGHPHYQMLEMDLLAIFRPSGQSQGPKLREAIRSLKLVRCDPTLGDEGLLIKAEQSRTDYEDALREHSESIESLFAEFAIEHLPSQIKEECVWPTDFNDPTRFGRYSNEDTYCLPLQVRMETIIRSPEFRCIFGAEGLSTIHQTIQDFYADESARVLRISLQNLPFAFNVREIVANAIGRHLLDMARDGVFRNSPTIVLLDEAHQFLNKTLGDENNRVQLDAFGLIAKEGRKYGLTICIATQRPRDLPQDVLSQMGTLVVHRLINDRDREVVERAAGEIDRSAAAFLPTLAPGEAILLGVDIPVPMSIKIEEPTHKPDSRGPDYQHAWAPEKT